MEGEDSMSKHIVLDGLPKNIVPDKVEFFRKFLSGQIAKKLEMDKFSLHFTIDEVQGIVNGAFLTFIRTQDAERALALLNRFPITKTDVIQTFRWGVFRDMKHSLPEYVAPEQEVVTDLSSDMMEDPLARPQFLVKYGPTVDVELYWYDYARQKVDVYKKPDSTKSDNLGKMTEMDRRSGKRAQPGLIYGLNREPKPTPIWTPLGSMLVTQHHSGLKFWGGKTFAQLFEVEENSIVAFQVSPMENFLVVKTDKDVAVWNLKQSKKLKTLAGFDPDAWPIAKFNADDTYVAVTNNGRLYVYETATMTLVQGGPQVHSFTLELPNLSSFEWSPTNGSHIALIFNGSLHEGWKVTIEEISVDEDNILHTNNLIRRNFLGTERVDVLWHPEGTGMAAKVTKSGNQADTAAVEYSLFRYHGKTVSADCLKLERKFSPERFSWQPSGKYFALVLMDVKADQTQYSGPKMFVRFYALDAKTGIKCVGEHPTSATSLHWAPKGSRLVAANYEKSLLEFYGINASGVAVPLNKAEHPAVSDTQWDPTGRFFASWNSCLKVQEGNRYRIFDLNGRKVFEKNAEKISHLAWRPYAKPVLSNDELKEITTNIKQYAAKYEAEDRKVEDELEQKKRDRRITDEENFIKRMEDIANDHACGMYLKGMTKEDRENTKNYIELRPLAPSARRQRQTLEKMPEDKQFIIETVTETRVKAREPVKQTGSKA